MSGGNSVMEKISQECLGFQGKFLEKFFTRESEGECLGVCWGKFSRGGNFSGKNVWNNVQENLGYLH